MPSPNPSRIAVAPSGGMIVVEFDSPVTAVLSPDDVQAIAFPSAPTAPTFTLSLGGHATAPIAVADAAPTPSATWTWTGLAPGAYDLFGWWYSSSIYSPAAVFDAFDGAAGPLDSAHRVGSTTVNQRIDPAQDVATTQRLMTATITGTSLSLRLTGAVDLDNSELIFAGYVGLRPVGSSATPTFLFGDQAVLTDGSGAWSAQPIDGTTHNGYRRSGGGTADVVAIDPAAVASALAALPNVGAGNVACAGSGVPSDPVLVHFTGALAGTAVATLVASDSAATIAHDGTNGSSVGGQYPAIAINGGSAIALTTPPIWGAGVASTPAHVLPYVAYPLPYSAPAVQVFPWNRGVFSSNNQYAWGPESDGAGGFQGVYSGGGVGSTTRHLQGLPPSTYQVAITWAPHAGGNAAATWTVVDVASSATLATGSVDQTVAPADFTAGGVAWKSLGTFTPTGPVGALDVTVSGGGAPRSGAVMLTRTGPDLTVAVNPGDSVTLTAPAGYAVTAAGAAPALAAVAATNLVGGSLLPAFDPASITMPIAENLDNSLYFSASTLLSNLRQRCSVAALAYDANGYPTRISGATTTTILSLPATDGQGSGRGIRNVAQGVFTVRWAGASAVTLVGGLSTTTTPVGSPVTVAGVTTALFDCRDTYNLAPVLYLAIHGSADQGDGTWTVDLTDLEIDPPDPADPTGDTAWEAPTRFLPTALSQLQGSSAIRCMNPLGINDSNVRALADLPTVDSFSTQGTSGGAQITRIEPYDPTVDGVANGGFFDPAARTIVKCTTVGAHGMYDGLKCTIYGVPGLLQLASGATLDLNGSTSLARVTSPTTFLFGDFTAGVMTNTIAPATGASVSWSIGQSAGMVTADLIALANTVGCDLWYNIPLLMDDATVGSLAATIATTLDRSLKLRLEQSNEVWNYGFWQFHQAVAFSQAIHAADPAAPYDGSQPQLAFYAQRKAHVDAIFVAAFIAAGRPASDVVRVLGMQMGGSSAAPSFAAACLYFGAAVDTAVIAPYWNNDPANVYGTSPSLQPVHDLLDKDRLLDLAELNSRYGDWESEFPAIQAGLATGGIPGVRVGTYEGSQAQVIPAGSTTPANDNPRSHAVARDPRYFGVVRQMMLNFQRAGCVEFCNFLLCGGLYEDFQWTAFLDNHQLPGTGSLSEAVDPEDLLNLKSQIGGAYRSWAIAAAAAGVSGEDAMSGSSSFAPAWTAALSARRRQAAAASSSLAAVSAWTAVLAPRRSRTPSTTVKLLTTIAPDAYLAALRAQQSPAPPTTSSIAGGSTTQAGGPFATSATLDLILGSIRAQLVASGLVPSTRAIVSLESQPFPAAGGPQCVISPGAFSRDRAWLAGMGRNGARLDGSFTVAAIDLSAVDIATQDTLRLLTPNVGLLPLAAAVMDALDGQFAVDDAGNFLSLEPVWAVGQAVPRRYPDKIAGWAGIELTFTLSYVDYRTPGR